MSTASSHGLSVAYNSVANGTITSSNNQVVSLPTAAQYCTMCSMQVLSDGGAAIDFEWQVTNLPRNFIQYGVTIFGQTTRDDSYASKMWSTVPGSTGTIAAGAQVSQMVVLATVVHRHSRLRLTWGTGNTGGAVGNIIVVVRAAGD